MSGLDDDLRRATDDLRGGLDDLDVGVFTPRRSPVPAAVAVLAVVVAIGAVLGAPWRDTSPSPTTVAVDSGTAEPADGTVPADPVPTAAVPTPTAVPQPTPAVEPTLASAPSDAASPRLGQLTGADEGEFFVLSPGVSAWNVDETMLLIYRTGAASPGHIVVSTATGETITDVDLTPPDIEQVYWDPTASARLVAFENNALWSFDVASGERTSLPLTSGCTGADAGHPSPPSAAGLLPTLCDSDSGRLVQLVDLVDGAQRSITAPANADGVVAIGRLVVVTTNDGLITVFDDQLVATDAAVDIDNEVFVAGARNGEPVAIAARFGGDAVGSVVSHPLDGAAPTVIVGPDAGNEYPPSGTQLSAVGDRIVFSTRGPATGELAGRIVLVDVAGGGAPIVGSFEHGSAGSFDNWSNVFVSLSPTGRYLAWSSDSGGDRVDTFISDFSEVPEFPP